MNTTFRRTAVAEPNLLDELEKIVALSERATPGPWRTDNHGDDEMQVVGRPSWGCKRFGKKGEWTVAGMDDMVGEHPSEVRANARLIAASVNFLRTHAPALADMAKRMEAAERELDIRRHELAHERAVRDRLERHLISIHALLYPAPIEVDGRVCVFRPRLIDPHEVMQELSDRIRAIPTAIDATQEGAG